MKKEEIINRIKSVIDKASTDIVDLIRSEGCTYFPYYTRQSLNDIRCRYDWVNASNDNFFKYFSDNLSKPRQTLSNMTVEYIDGHVLEECIMTQDEKTEFISEFEKNAQELRGRQTQIDELYDKITETERQLKEMKSEYKKITNGEQYYVD